MTTGTVYTVSSTAELKAAYQALSTGGGGTILLNDLGNRDTISLKGGGSGPVLITSAAPDAPTLIGRITLENVTNVTIDNIALDSTGIERAGWINDISVTGSTGVTISNSTFTGNANGVFDGTAAETLGITRGNADFAFTGNTVSNYYHGLSIFETVGVTVIGNEISQMQGDGLRMAGIQDAVILDNHFHDFIGAPQTFTHNDMIQLWSTNATLVSKNILIEGNILDTGAGSATQSIFLGNEQLGKDPTHVYENITIANNLIYNGQQHGIYVSGADGVTVADNTLLWNKDAYIDTGTVHLSNPPRIFLQGVTGGVIENNISSNDIGAPTGTAMSGNVVLSYANPADPAYAYAHFVNLAAGATAEMRDLRLVPESPLNGLVGADASQPVTQSAGGVEAVMRAAADPADLAVWTFDATLSLDAAGPIGPAGGYTAVWTFADGSTMTGFTVTRAFADTAPQQVQLAIVKGGVVQDSIARPIDPVEKELLRIDFDTPEGPAILDESSYASKLGNADPARLVEGAPGEGMAYQLDGGSPLTVTRGNAQLFNLQSFRIGLDLGLQAPGATGTFLLLHTVMTGSVSADGTLSYSLKTGAGTFLLKSAAPVLTDTAMHRIEIAYDDRMGRLALFVDGAEVAGTTAAGTTPPPGSHGLVFGNPWGGTLSARIDNIEMSLDSGLRPPPAPPEPELPAETGTQEAGGTSSISAEAPPEASPEEAPEPPMAPKPPPVLITGTDGNDRIDGGEGDEIILGGLGADTLYGGGGDDLIEGDQGDDRLFGGEGNDTLKGGAGRDRLDGGAGDDILEGGAGRDVFVFSDGFGNDTITDFEVGLDRIDLRKLDAATSFDDLVAHHLSVQENDLVLTFEGDGTITILNFGADTVPDAGMFLI